MAGVLDSSRMAYWMSTYAGVSVKNVHATVLGGHGDTMVPVMNNANVDGEPSTQYFDNVDDIVKHTRYGGAEVLELRSTGSAYIAPAAAVTEMVEAIAYDREQILPCVAVKPTDDLCFGIPCMLGSMGILPLSPPKLTDSEQQELNHSKQQVKSDIEQAKHLLKMKNF